MQPQELTERLFSDRDFEVVDVRTGFEFRAGHIPGAIHAPTWKIVLGLAPLPAIKETPLVVLCELGPRARIAKSLLGLLGYRNVTLLEGHMAGWRRSGRPMKKG